MIPFQFEAPISFFEKADAGEGRQRRIGGVISTESKDRQREIVIQKGLDFTEFKEFGWFNDNHSKATDGILGYPDLVRPVAAGEVLPDGKVCKAAGTWAEGYLLDTPKALSIWELGRSLQKSGRRLGFSIEGNVEQRTGPLRNIIAKARVRNVAITNCPVNSDTRLEVLAKSLETVARMSDAAFEKALTAGSSTAPASTLGPLTGEGAGRVLMPQSLETGQKRLIDGRKKKKMSKAEAMVWLHERMPHLSATTIGRIVDHTIRAKF